MNTVITILFLACFAIDIVLAWIIRTLFDRYDELLDILSNAVTSLADNIEEVAELKTQFEKVEELIDAEKAAAEAEENYAKAATERERKWLKGLDEIMHF